MNNSALFTLAYIFIMFALKEIHGKNTTAYGKMKNRIKRFDI